MLFQIIKDSVILFLLIYALLTLAEKLCKYIARITNYSNEQLPKYYVIDTTDTPTEKLEYLLRKELASCQDSVFVITNEANTEANAIIEKLTCDFAALSPIRKEELHTFITVPSMQDASLKAVSSATQGQDK